jgi:hypothetical protein
VQTHDQRQVLLTRNAWFLDGKHASQSRRLVDFALRQCLLEAKGEEHVFVEGGELVVSHKLRSQRMVVARGDTAEGLGL